MSRNKFIIILVLVLLVIVFGLYIIADWGNKTIPIENNTISGPADAKASVG